MHKNVKKTCFLLLILFFLGLSANPALAATSEDGKYYFDQLKETMLEILSESQGLINTKPDGSMKHKKLAPKAFYKKTYNQFKKIGVGKTFKMKSMKGETDPAKIAPALTTLLQAGRITTAKAQKIINTEADGSVKLKKFIPAVFGRLVVERFTQKTGVHMKQTTLGKNGFKERNAYNGPNDWEKIALEKFMAADWEVNEGYGITEEGEYRYVKPIYIKKGCLKCHGTPIGEKGPYGHPREGYETNDIRGGISISLINK